MKMLQLEIIEEGPHVVTVDGDSYRSTTKNGPLAQQQLAAARAANEGKF